jgi:hypothetical protein
MALGWTGHAHPPTGPKAIDHGGLWFHLTTVAQALRSITLIANRSMTTPVGL